MLNLFKKERDMNSEKVKLVLVSFLALFVELSFIRWIPAHVFSIAFFSNIVLIASFLGLGLGLLIASYKRDLFNFFPAILFGIVMLVLFLQLVQVDFLVDKKTWIWSYYSGNRLKTMPFAKISIVQLVTLIYILTLSVFIPIGQKIGKIMKGFEPLFAYSLNILGSLLGVAVFGLFSFFQTPAYVWFLAGGLVTVLVNYRERFFFPNALLVLVTIAAIGLSEKDIIWSPYYAITTDKRDDGGIAVYVNQLFHQKAVNFENEPHLYDKYIAPYKWFKPKKVLIVGAGTGNDVYIARSAGAEHIDAVEIDPVILKLGHPLKPYTPDGKVRVFIDDARSFFHNAKDKYDMVVYGTLDSHATLAVASSVRLDNYMYTHEALEEARQLLAPNGVMVLLFSVPQEWLAVKLLQTARDVFGSTYTRFMFFDNYLFNLMILAGPGINQLSHDDFFPLDRLLPVQEIKGIDTPTDNWPYLYLAERGIPLLYSTILLVVVSISLGGLYIFSPLRKGKINPVYFFLGCGFLLLETKSVTTFSLLFGSTWVVNAVVFSSILGIALVANWIVMKKQLNNPNPFFLGLILSLGFLYFFPSSRLLRLNFPIKVICSGFLIALPILFSSFIFAILIKRTKDIGAALGSNLLGAVIGGFLEYSSMVWGLNALYLVALACYVIPLTYLIRRPAADTL